MRQKIKYFLFIFYYLFTPYCMYKSITGSDLMVGAKLVFFALSLVLLMFLIFSIILSSSSNYLCFILSPKLDKRIIHESGVYYVKYNVKYYILYRDNFIFKIILVKYNASNIEDQKSLIGIIKGKLDFLYVENLIKHNKRKFLQDWDGYTSVDGRRDNKINQII